MLHSVRRSALLLVLPIVLAAGCHPPPGHDSGRLGASSTTVAERQSEQIPLTSIVEASDKVSQDLARDVARIAGEVGKGYRVTVVFGDLENKTQGVVNTTDFETTRERIKSRLVQSGFFRDNVRFVANRAALESLNNREIAGTQPAPLNPEYTLYLSGFLSGSFRGTSNYYYMNFKLIRASDGEEIFNNDYEIKRG
jgi:hypothetical protein